jgi:DNA-binding transcriptional LysR family regulator
MNELLTCFLAVVDAGNLSAAARVLHLAVSSVSRKIDTLEAELGVTLLHRSSRKILLTDAGERFLPHARRLVADLASARAALHDTDPEPRGLLSITAPTAFGRRHVAAAVAGFQHRYPLVQVDMHISDEIVDLTAQRIDVAIRIGILPDSDLQATLLAPHYRVACASPAYLARRGKPEVPHDLLEHDCARLNYKSGPLGLWCFAGVNDDKPLAVQGSMRSDDVDAMVPWAVAGGGVVHLASWLVSEAIESGQLVEVLGPQYYRRDRQHPAIHAVRMPGRSHPVKAQLFIAHLREHFGEPPYWDRVFDSV